MDLWRKTTTFDPDCFERFPGMVFSMLSSRCRAGWRPCWWCAWVPGARCWSPPWPTCSTSPSISTSTPSQSTLPQSSLVSERPFFFQLRFGIQEWRLNKWCLLSFRVQFWLIILILTQSRETLEYSGPWTWARASWLTWFLSSCSKTRRLSWRSPGCCWGPSLLGWPPRGCCRRCWWGRLHGSRGKHTCQCWLLWSHPLVFSFLEEYFFCHWLCSSPELTSLLL